MTPQHFLSRPLSSSSHVQFSFSTPSTDPIILSRLPFTFRILLVICCYPSTLIIIIATTKPGLHSATNTNPESCFDTESEDSDRDTNSTDVDTGDEPDDDADLSWIANQDNVYPPEYYINQEIEFDEAEFDPEDYVENTLRLFRLFGVIKGCWHRYCKYVGRTPEQSIQAVTLRLLYSFFDWLLCGRRICGINVNEILDPDRVGGIYAQNPSFRAPSLALDRGRNYGVVQLTLEHLYEKLYMQGLHSFSPSEYGANIINNCQIISASQSKDSSIMLRLSPVQVQRLGKSKEEEELEVDHVFTATGCTRNAHEEILSDINPLLPTSSSSGKFGVKRDYSVIFDQGRVGENAGVWLPG